MSNPRSNYQRLGAVTTFDIAPTSLTSFASVFSSIATVALTAALLVTVVVMYNSGIIVKNSPNVTLDTPLNVIGFVEVTNFPENQTINGVVEVSNFPQFTLTIDNSTFIVTGLVEVSNFPAVQPVSGTVAVSNFPATQPVSGSVSVSNFPVTQAVSGSISISNFPVTQPVSGSVSVSNFPATQPVSGSVTVSGSVSVSNFPVTQAVSGSISVSNFPVTQPVSGSISISNFPVTQPVSGSVTVSGSVSVSNFPVTQAVSGSISISNFPVTQPVSGTVSISSFPATQTVNGTVNVGNFPATQPVSGTVAVSNFPATQTVNGSVTVTGLTLTTNLNNTLFGTLDNGQLKAVPVSAEGHIEVAIHSPSGAFGNVLTDDLTVEFQFNGVMGINSGTMITTVSPTGGTVNAANSAIVVSSGTAVAAFGLFQSRKRVYYRSGQGTRMLFTAMFTTPVATSYQLAGMGNPEDGFFFGYQNTTFGILWNQRGQRAVQTYTVATGNTGGAVSLTITLNGVANSCAVTNATATGGLQRTVYEISQCVFIGWTAEPVGGTVVFLKNAAGPVAGAFTITGGTVTGAFAATRAGLLVTQTFIAQSTWNVDKLDGNGPSGATLVQTNFNVYGISMQYLGAGAIRFFVETTPDTNDARLVVVHAIKYPNTQTQTSIATPSFPFSALVANTGAAPISSVSVSVASVAGFVEGTKRLTGNSYAFTNFITNAGTGTCSTLFTIRNKRVNSNAYGTFANQGIINIIRVGVSLKHTQPAFLYMYRSNENFRHTLAASGNFAPNFATYSTNSITLFDNSQGVFTVTDNSQLQWAGAVSDTGGNLETQLITGLDAHTLEPGESLTLCATTVQNTAAFVLATLTIREDS